MAERRLKGPTLPDAPAMRRNSDAVRMESRKPKAKTLRVVSWYRWCQARHVAWRRTEAPAEISPSSGSTILIMVAARGSGTEAARVTRIDLRRRKSAKRFAFSRKEKVIGSRYLSQNVVWDKKRGISAKKIYAYNIVRIVSISHVKILIRN